MIRAERFIIIFAAALLGGCGQAAKENTDLSGHFDTLYVKPGATLVLQRYHTFRAQEQDLYDHLPIRLMYTDTARYEYAIDSGMLVYNNKYFTATYYVDPARAIKTEDKTMTFLDAGQERMAIIYKGNFLPEKIPTATCYLKVRDTTALLHNAENKLDVTEKRVNGIYTSAYIDGTQWKLFKSLLNTNTEKDSIRLNIDLKTVSKKKKSR